MFSERNQMVMLSKHGCVPKLAQSKRGILENRGDATEVPLAFFGNTIIPLLNANSLELGYYSK